MRFLIFLLLFTCFASSSKAQYHQDTIVLLNGDVVIASVIDTSGMATSIRNPKNAKRNILIENDRIFSITDSTGEHVLYVYDTTIGNEFTIPEMRDFIAGEQDAEKGFKAAGSFYGNMALAAACGVTGLFISPVPPFIFTALTGIPKVRIRHETVRDLALLQHDAYIMGYERVARKKRKVRSLLGGGIGLAVGLGTHFILKSTGNEIIP